MNEENYNGMSKIELNYSSYTQITPDMECYYIEGNVYGFRVNGNTFVRRSELDTLLNQIHTVKFVDEFDLFIVISASQTYHDPYVPRPEIRELQRGS